MLNPKSHQVKSDMTTDNTSERDDGGPAFPRIQQIDRFENIVVEEAPGMTLRDYFAAKSAPTLLSLCHQDSHEGQDYLSYCAGLSYKMADAMLKARKQ